MKSKRFCRLVKRAKWAIHHAEISEGLVTAIYTGVNWPGEPLCRASAYRGAADEWVILGVDDIARYATIDGKNTIWIEIPDFLSDEDWLAFLSFARSTAV